MSCRTSRFLPPDASRFGPVTCADCGAGSLTVFYTSKDQHIHLCPSCFESRVKRGLAKKDQAAE
ncbi:MAG: hypothetical protein C4293_12780 [Nitrospiraceae bacterium]